MCGSTSKNKANINCEEGRRLGCGTFCCRLLVRLDPNEMEPTDDGMPPKGFVDKLPDGNCIHFHPDKQICKIWHKRPRVCREYECNSDFLLQVVLRNGFSTLGKLAKQASKSFIPKETYIDIPLLDDDHNDQTQS
ncbi:MAG: YkgJ family cysteine cluster protein [Gammaproteobacteria bacterium]